MSGFLLAHFVVPAFPVTVQIWGGISVATQGDQSSVPSMFFGAVAGVFAGITLGVLRLLQGATFTHHDRSALLFLGSKEYFETPSLDVTAFADAPIYPDNQRRYELKNELYTNNDPRDIIGFVIGEPRLLKNPPHDGECGYYVYVVINWEYGTQFKRWSKRGFAIQLSALPNSDGAVDRRNQDNRHLLISPFGADRTNESRILDICEGPLYSLRWQPYKKWGFETHDLVNRSMSWQCKLLTFRKRRQNNKRRKEDKN